MVTLKTEKSQTLADGAHIGLIKELELRSGKTKDGVDYSYVDMKIESEGAMVKAGFSARLNPNTELGKLITMFGFNSLQFGMVEVDLDKLLVGRKVQFRTLTERSGDNGKYYSNVKNETIMPAQ